MPNLSNITVQDRESTPVSHTFSPNGEDAGLAIFVEAGDTMVGNNTLTISSRDTGTNVKVRVKLDMPTVLTETVNGISSPRVVRRSVIDATLSFAKSSTLQERQNAIGIFANTLSASQTDVDKVVTAVEKWF